MTLNFKLFKETVTTGGSVHYKASDETGRWSWMVNMLRFGSNRGLFEGTIPALTWREWENPW